MGVSNGIQTLATAADIIKALEDSGFEVLDSFDMNRDAHSECEIPWYQPMDDFICFSKRNFRKSRFGRAVGKGLIYVLEFLFIAPKGLIRISQILDATARDLVDGGKKDIFTPSFFFLARKK